MPKELEDLGLSEKEARVYLAALELGQNTAERIAKQASVNRSTTYVQLDSLMKMGLISTHEEDKKTLFAPESPEILRRLVARQKDRVTARERELDELLPALMRQYEGAGERPVVRFFPGKEGILAVREEVLSAKTKDLYVVLSSENMTKIFTKGELEGYTERRMKLGIRSHAIYTKKEYFEHAMSELNELTEHRFLPDSPLTIDIRIFDDKTAIFSLDGALFAMVLESKQIASSMRNVFQVLWRCGDAPKA